MVLPQLPNHDEKIHADAQKILGEVERQIKKPPTDTPYQQCVNISTDLQQIIESIAVLSRSIDPESGSSIKLGGAISHCEDAQQSLKEAKNLLKSQPHSSLNKKEKKPK